MCMVALLDHCKANIYKIYVVQYIFPFPLFKYQWIYLHKSFYILLTIWTIVYPCECV